jgi:tetratricopeptide (TPR) repeat protein
LLDLGDAQLWSGHLAGAEQAYRQALALAEEHGDADGGARSRSALGKLYTRASAFDQARTHLEQARDHFARAGNRFNLQKTLRRLGRVHAATGDYAAALTCFEQQLALAQDLGARRDEYKALQHIGWIHLQQAHYDQARTYLLEARAAAQALGHDEDVAAISGHLGLVHAALGEYTQALVCYAQDLAQAVPAGALRRAGHVASYMGQVYLGYGEYGRAEQCFTYLLETALAEEDWTGLALALVLLGDTNKQQGDYAVAEGYYQRAVGLAQAIRLHYAAAFQLAAADLYLRQGQHAAAAPLLAAGLAQAATIGDGEAVFQGRLLQIQYQIATGQIETPAAVVALEALLPDWAGTPQEATLHYEIWHLDPRQEAHREAAIALYRRFYQETPELEERLRIETLTSADLPDPPPLPDLPPVIAAQVPDRPALLARADAVIASAVGAPPPPPPA